MLVSRKKFILFLFLFLINFLIATTKTKLIRTKQVNKIKQIKDFETTDPPVAPVRNVAQFDPMQGILIHYPLVIPPEMVAEMAEDVVVTTIVANSGMQNQAINEFENASVNLDNCNFLIAPSNSQYVREYGPWFIIDGNRDFGIVNFPYDGYISENDDDDIPIEMANFLNLNLYGMNLAQNGGNYTTDGRGISVSTERVWNYNPNLTHDEINQMMEAYLGIETYHVVDDAVDLIGHIDLWLKFLNIDKILIRSVPTSHAQYDEIESVVQYFSQQISSWGNSYEIYRVYTPNNEPYTNSLILNDKVFVPLVDSEWDNEAIAAYQEAMPGYEILGFYGSWGPTDAINCRTRGIADTRMLSIKHNPILGQVSFQDEINISAEIDAHSGEEILTDSTRVYYCINDNSYNSIIMDNISGNDFSANIPLTDEDCDVSYYIHSADLSGRSINHPYIGRADPHKFTICGTDFPEIVVDTVLSISCEEGSFISEELIIENIGGGELNYEFNHDNELISKYSYQIPDSPLMNTYNYNTYTELGWTNYAIADTAEINKLIIDFHWLTEYYQGEGMFLLESPIGTQETIITACDSGWYSLVLDNFTDEFLYGNWKIWIEDPTGFGLCRAQNIELTALNPVEQLDWLGINPDSGSIDPNSSEVITLNINTTNLEAGDYIGKIELNTNDSDEDSIIISLNIHINPSTKVDHSQAIFTNNINNYPNPFNPSTKIGFNVEQTAPVKLVIYNIKGEKINTLIDNRLAAGNHRVVWNGLDKFGKKASSGVYLYKLSTEKYTSTKKMILMK